MLSPSRLLLLFAIPLLLAGCSASVKQRIAACQAGDWQQIGKTDGLDGAPATFAERKEFCDDHGNNPPAAQDAGVRYAAGWQAGNAEMWSTVGAADGARGLPQAQFAVRAAGEEVRKRKTPVNQPAYDAGWLKGNAQYWEGIGKRDGVAGQPATRADARRSEAAASPARFDAAAYGSGWRVGNRQFWQDAGANDAANGVPDKEFLVRAATARDAGVQVQEDVYRAAWNAGIVSYWRNLGARDAVCGTEFAARGREAKAKGLKIFEADYRQAWEKRLADYWSQAGRDDGYGKPFQLDQRIASAGRDGVFVIAATRALYGQAWDAENARYCVPDNAFERGRANAGMAVEVCREALRNPLKRAYMSGQDYAIAEAKQQLAVNEASQLEASVIDTRRRLDRLDRDRNGQSGKDKPAKDDAAKEDRRREQERRELVERLRRQERQLDDARRWIDQNDFQMRSLRRSTY
ncbi:MAG: DUF2799 domain-containing protein [Duganella sp.]